MLRSSKIWVSLSLLIVYAGTLITCAIVKKTTHFLKGIVTYVSKTFRYLEIIQKNM